MYMSKVLKALAFPLNYFWARLFSESYARHIGVNIKGVVRIYGSSLNTFGSEPYLVTLGNNVYISVEAMFICHDGSTLPFRKDYPSLELADQINVGENVFIGARAVILPGVKIGNNCIIGACAVVTSNVDDNSIVAGVPARKIKDTSDFISESLDKSLGFGHLQGKEKIAAYKKRFQIDS